MERYYVNRWERVTDLRIERELVTTTTEVDGVLKSVVETEVTWKVVAFETDYASSELRYKGKEIEKGVFPGYFGPKAERLAIDDARQFCQSYSIERGDPLEVVVVSWTERVECKSLFDNEEWWRTEKPVEETEWQVVWSSREL